MPMWVSAFLFLCKIGGATNGTADEEVLFSFVSKGIGGHTCVMTPARCKLFSKSILYRKRGLYCLGCAQGISQQFNNEFHIFL